MGQGVGPRRALLWSIATCLPQPLVAIPSFMFVEAFTVGRKNAAVRLKSVGQNVLLRVAIPSLHARRGSRGYAHALPLC